MCTARLGLIALALAWPEVALAFENVRPGQSHRPRSMWAHWGLQGSITLAAGSYIAGQIGRKRNKLVPYRFRAADDSEAHERSPPVSPHLVVF